MADYNIQMHSYNGSNSAYDNLYPRTTANQVAIWGYNFDYTVQSWADFVNAWYSSIIADPSSDWRIKGSAVFLDNGQTLQEWIDSPHIDPVLDNNDYATIQAASLAGTASSYWSVGDVKWVPINWGYGGTVFNGKIGMTIIGFDHNKSVETGDSSSIHFQFMYWNSTGNRACLCDSQYSNLVSGSYFNMNTTNTNNGGWSSSYMRSTVIPAFKNALPNGLQSVIRTITKYTSRPNNTGVSTSTSDDIFLLSEQEIYGGISHSGNAVNQVQYTYYSNLSITIQNYVNTIMYQHSDAATAAMWWTRSPSKQNEYCFCFANSTGSVGTNPANDSLGFTPCLCI